MKLINFKLLEIKKIMPILLVYAMMILLAIVANIINPGFLSSDNLYSILKQVAFLGIASIGQTLVILTGGIDLSLRYLILLSNVLAAQMINGREANTLSSFFFIMAACIIVGLVNGAGVYFLKIPAMIMTLATGTALYGITLLYCKGAPGGHASESLSNFVNQKVFGLLNGGAVVWFVLAILIMILLNYTTFGRSIYAIGTNQESARYSGINVPVTLFAVYIIAAIMAGITGFLFLGYTKSGYLSTAASYNMDSIAAVVVGGTSILGGSGGYVGTIAGVGIMMILESLMKLLHIAESGKQMVQGILIIVMVVLAYGRRKKH